MCNGIKVLCIFLILFFLFICDFSDPNEKNSKYKRFTYMRNHYFVGDFKNFHISDIEKINFNTDLKNIDTTNIYKKIEIFKKNVPSEFLLDIDPIDNEKFLPLNSLLNEEDFKIKGYIYNKKGVILVFENNIGIKILI